MKHTKRCRGTETRFTHLPVRDGFLDACGCPRIVRMESLRCATCGAWLPLGPSNEMPVEVEVRATDLGDAGFGDWRPINKSREEVDGLIAFERNREAGADVGDRPMWHAGWLAGAILFHDREQRQQVLL